MSEGVHHRHQRRNAPCNAVSVFRRRDLPQHLMLLQTSSVSEFDFVHVTRSDNLFI